MKARTGGALILSLLAAAALIGFGVARRSWLLFLFSAVCLTAGAWVWGIQKGVEKRISRSVGSEKERKNG